MTLAIQSKKDSSKTLRLYGYYQDETFVVSGVYLPNGKLQLFVNNTDPFNTSLLMQITSEKYSHLNNESVVFLLEGFDPGYLKALGFKPWENSVSGYYEYELDHERLEEIRKMKQDYLMEIGDRDTFILLSDNYCSPLTLPGPILDELNNGSYIHIKALPININDCDSFDDNIENIITKIKETHLSKSHVTISEFELKVRGVLFPTGQFTTVYLSKLNSDGSIEQERVFIFPL